MKKIIRVRDIIPLISSSTSIDLTSHENKNMGIFNWKNPLPDEYLNWIVWGLVPEDPCTLCVWVKKPEQKIK